MSKKKQVRVALDLSQHDLEGSFAFVISRLQQWLESVPEHCRNSAHIELSAEESYGSPFIEVESCYYRDETDEERGERISKAQRMLEQAVRETERRELKTLKELKEKYGQ